MVKHVEVVVFFGPPNCGKTTYYRHNLKRSHERISAVDLFTEDPTLGLRDVILRIVSQLNGGENIVIDDENWSRSTRLSYIKSISSKVPDCTFRCMKFTPSGSLTLRWLQEWHLAKTALDHDDGPTLDDLAQREARLQQWLGEEGTRKGPQTPTAEEGFRVQDVQVKLTAEAEYKFEVPALFIQWEGIIQCSDDDTADDDNNKLLERTKGLLETWISCNPWGRIIVVSEGSHHADPGKRTSSDQIITSLKTTLTKLSQSLPSPIYFYHLPAPCPPTRPFSSPPQPGLVAFLQRFHHIHLWHRSTIYLYHSKEHADSAQAVGVKHLKVASALASPHLVYLTQCSSGDAVDPILKNIKLLSPLDSLQQRSTPRIPLYSKVIESRDEGCYVLDLACGRALGICYKDREALDRYQELYAETATHISDSGSKMVTRIPGGSSAADGERQTTNSADSAVHAKRTNTQASTKSETQQTTRGLPSWMTSQSLKPRKKVGQLIDGESLEDSSLEEPVKKKKSDAPHLPSTVYCMSPIELYETALLVLQENEHSDDSYKSNTRDASSTSQETQLPPPKTNVADAVVAEGEPRSSAPAASTGTAEKKPEEREACLLDDIFLTGSPGMKPPPRRAKAAQKNRQSPSVLPECLAPETVTSVPETAGYTAASMGVKDSTTAFVGESSKKRKGDGSKANKGPDLSFLDDIF